MLRDIAQKPFYHARVRVCQCRDQNQFFMLETGPLCSEPVLYARNRSFMLGTGPLCSEPVLSARNRSLMLGTGP